MTEQELEQAKRAKLKAEKPAVYEKVLKIKERFEQGIPTPIVDIVYRYACNLHCSHCCASKRFTPAVPGPRLTPASLRRFTDEADAYGLCQFNLSGGEPLLLKDFDQVVAALQPDKFHLSMSTNGFFLDAEMAKRLKSIGWDKIRISLDHFDEAEHDRNRNRPGAYKKAVKALENAKNAGLSVVIQTVVSHQNCRTGQLEEMAKFATANGYSVDVLIARAIGELEGHHEILVDEEDSKYIYELHQQYPVIHRDTFPCYGMDKGCGCVNAVLHLTPFGDILPCVFIHIGIGNIFTESLETIINRGLSIKHFSNYSAKCLSGEDRGFIAKYMTKFYGKPLPISWKDAFTDEDFIS